MTKAGPTSIVLLALLAPLVPAQAATIDMTRTLLLPDGRPMPDPLARPSDDPATKDPECTKCPPLTLGAAAAHALFAQSPADKNLPGDVKWARGALALRIENEKAAKLTAEEVATIKKLMGWLYGPAVIVRAFPLLDPNAKPPEVK